MFSARYLHYWCFHLTYFDRNNVVLATTGFYADGEYFSKEMETKMQVSFGW